MSNRPPRSSSSDSAASGSFGLGSALTLALLLTLPVLAICRIQSRTNVTAVVAWIAVASACTYFLYDSDKRKARAGEWRTLERVLHFWEFLGGWPAAFIAQRVLRHKSAKVSYLVVFWLIVAVHQFVALDGLRDWKITRHAARFCSESTSRLK